MSFGKLGAMGRGFGHLGGLGSVSNPASFASSAAPTGYHWEFVTDNGVRVTDNGIPVVDTVRTS